MKRQSFTSSLLVIFTFCTLPLISQVTEPHPVTDTEEIFKIVEEMPMFPGVIIFVIRKARSSVLIIKCFSTSIKT